MKQTVEYRLWVYKRFDIGTIFLSYMHTYFQVCKHECITVKEFVGCLQRTNLMRVMEK